MNSNDLMYYLKGFVELTNEPPSREQWGIIRAKVLGASAVETFVVGEPPMHNPTNMNYERPFLDSSKLPPMRGFPETNVNCGCAGFATTGQSVVEGG